MPDHDEEPRYQYEHPRPSILDEPERGVHEMFGLTYANYLVLHRSAMQSMPMEWQVQFVKLVEELNDAIDWPEGHDKVWSFQVTAKDSGGKFMRDPVPNYDRGRTRMPLKDRSDVH